MKEESIELTKYLKLIFRNTRTIALFSFLIGISGFLTSLLLDDIYKSSAVLMPTSSSDVGMTQSLGGMASMVGIEIGDSNTDKTKLANQILISLDF